MSEVEPLLGEVVAGTALAGMALIGAGLLAIDGRLLPGRHAVPRLGHHAA